MKKILHILVLFIFTIFLSLSFINGFSQKSQVSSKYSCTNHSREIPRDSDPNKDSVAIYAAYDTLLVQANPTYAARQIKLTKEELSCISKIPSPLIKFIIASTSPTKGDNVFIIVETKEKGKYHYYDLDTMYPSICPKPKAPTSSHLCPPPANCAIPFTAEDL